MVKNGCYSNCPNGYYLSNNACDICTGNCLTCVNTRNNCLTCILGIYDIIRLLFWIKLM